MIQGFFFDGIDAKAAGAAITGQYDSIIVAGAHETQSLLAFVELAVTGTDIALDAAILQLMPVMGREIFWDSCGIHNSLLTIACA